MFNFISKIEELDIPCRHNVEANRSGSIETIIVTIYGIKKHLKFSMTLNLMEPEKVIVEKYDKFLNKIKQELATHYYGEGVII